MRLTFITKENSDHPLYWNTILKHWSVIQLQASFFASESAAIKTAAKVDGIVVTINVHLIE